MLEQAATTGYFDPTSVRTEPAFAALWESPDYQELLKKRLHPPPATRHPPPERPPAGVRESGAKDTADAQPVPAAPKTPGPAALPTPGRVLTIDRAAGFVGWSNRALFVPGSQTVVFSNSVQGGVVWDVKNHLILRKFDRHGVYVHVWGLAVSPDGQQVLTGDDKGQIFLWNVNTAQLVRAFAGHRKRIAHLGFASDGKRFVSLAGDDGEVCVWDPASGACQKSPANCPLPPKEQRHQEPEFAITHSPDARHLLLGHPDGNLLWFEVATGKTLHRWKGHETPVGAVAVSPNRQLAVSGGFDGTIRLWDLRTRQQLAALTGHAGTVNWLVFTPSNRRLVSGGADKTVRSLGPDSSQRDSSASRVTLRASSKWTSPWMASTHCP